VSEARILVAQGRSPEAEALLREALASEPADEEALLLLAGILLDTGREEASLQLLRRAVDARPESARARDAHARALHALHHDDPALGEAQEARRLLALPENAAHAASVYLTLVWCLREKRMLKEALAMAEEGLSRVSDAVLAQWAGTIEEELAEAEKERC
jgi:tetratricopeptide (TPR) repeat protein